jgi:hypothetical protein
MIVVLEKRVSVELDHLISNAATAKLVAHGLGDEHDNLYREVSFDGGGRYAGA